MLMIDAGLTPVQLGKHPPFECDLVDWALWYTEEAQPAAAGPNGGAKLPGLVRDRLKALYDIDANPTEADAFLSEVLHAYYELKKKQVERRTSPHVTESTPSS